MELKINTNAIYKRIPKEVKSSEQLNDLFRETLTDDENIFAAIDFGVGCYVWTLPSGYDWHKLSEAADTDMVRNILSEKKSLIRRKLSGVLESWQLDAVFSVPSDDFIYYSKDELGIVNVRLVAWDYQLPAKMEAVGGGFKRPAPPALQDVRLMFKEAGKPAAHYRCLVKTLNNSVEERAADETGCIELKGLCVGYHCIIKSADKLHDFSFVVEKEKDEYVFDVTGELLIEVEVVKDGRAGKGLPVRVTYKGTTSELVTDECGLASLKTTYWPDADVIVRVEDKLESVKAEYPATRMTFDLHTPLATVEVSRLRNGHPLPGADVIVSVSGISSQMVKTGQDGTLILNLPFRSDAELSVETAGEVKSRKMEMENKFIFEDEVPETFSPVLRVLDTNGEAISEYSVSVEISGQSKEYVTDISGKVMLPEVEDRQEMKVTDMSIPSAVCTYQLDHEIPEYEFIIPAKEVAYYDIHVRYKNGDLPQESTLSILQNGKNVVLHPDQEGYCRLRKDHMEAGVNALAIVNLADEEFGRTDVTFVHEEDDYEIILDRKRKSLFGHILKQLLVATATVGLFAVAFSAFCLLF